MAVILDITSALRKAFLVWGMGVDDEELVQKFRSQIDCPLI